MQTNLAALMQFEFFLLFFFYIYVSTLEDFNFILLRLVFSFFFCNKIYFTSLRPQEVYRRIKTKAIKQQLRKGQMFMVEK